MMRPVSFFLFLVLVAAHCSKPTVRDLDGKIKGKASLRLADGSTISRDNSDEYRPQIVTLSDGYLVLAFGSDRGDGGCTAGLHNIYIAKSLTPYDGVSLPSFDTPRPLTNEGPCINDAARINFALVPNGTEVKVYLNYHAEYGNIRVAAVSSFTNPSPAFASINNSNHSDNTVIGANAAGNRLVTTDLSGTAYVMNPDVNIAADPYGFGLNNAESALQVRQEVSGYDDAYIASIYGSSLATTSSFPFGPIIDLDFSLIGSGLFLSSVGAFYSSDAYGDLVLFSAYGEFSEDMYVITSHTAGGLWNLVGFFGSEAFLPPAPTPDHYFTFDGGTCGVNEIGTWTGTCTSVGVGTTNVFDGSDYALFSGSSKMDLGVRDLGAQFTLSAWVYLGPSETGLHTIVANAGGTGINDGFRLYVDASNQRISFVVGDGTNTQTISSFASTFPLDTWNHVAVAVDKSFNSVSLFVNGSYVNDMSYGWSAPITTIQTNTGNVIWGTTTAAPGYGLVGAMEKVRIHLRALSYEEILGEFLAF